MSPFAAGEVNIIFTERQHHIGLAIAGFEVADHDLLLLIAPFAVSFKLAIRN